MEIHPIARIHSDFPGKFGIPRQSGLVPELRSRIIFEPEYRNRDAIRGLEDFSHLWLIWEFSETIRGEWSPTVRPPKLGGNKRMGVFATRSPFRPNSLALSCVELQDIIFSKEDGPILEITGADLMDRTPIYDIKPYLPYADCKPLATGGFTCTSSRNGSMSAKGCAPFLRTSSIRRRRRSCVRARRIRILCPSTICWIRSFMR